MGFHTANKSYFPSELECRSRKEQAKDQNQEQRRQERKGKYVFNYLSD